MAVACALCVLAGITSPCPHRAPDAVRDEVSPPGCEWLQAGGEPGGKERRTMSPEECLYELEFLEVRGEMVEVEHRWPRR
jgi:hypothetical protein